MFKTLPTAIAHTSCADKGMYVASEYIISKVDEQVRALKKFCPHRQYPIGTTGEYVDKLVCKLHGFTFNPDGSPINNDKKLSCSDINIGKSGIVWRGFKEPDHKWVDDLANEKNLEYSHITKHTSKGSWLWNMDLAVDLLHFGVEGIHPFLSKQVSTDDLVLEEGDGWVMQTHPTGWWVWVFPFTFIEYGDPGCLVVNYMVPHNVNNEYGFDWSSQFYYDPNVSVEKRLVFETLDLAYSEDVAAVELQRGDYYPLMKAFNHLEDHCVSWGKWYKENKI